jgi:scaffold protein (connect acetoacetyl-CoA thiolase and HMG-CoA synthase)
VDLPRYHRLRGAYYRLEGRRCRACGEVAFPPRPACRACRSTDLEPYRLCGRGTVYSFTEMAQAPAGFPPPHLMALVQLEEGPLVAAQLTDLDPERIAVGLPVEMVTRRLQERGRHGYLVYGYKFRPRLAATGAEPSAAPI